METDYAVSPGDFLAEWLENQGSWIPLHISFSLGLDIAELHRFLSGSYYPSDQLFVNLEELTGIPYMFWVETEEIYTSDLKRLNLAR